MQKDAITDLCERLHVLRLRYQVVFNELTPASPPYIPMAEALMRGLADCDDRAVQLSRAIVDPAECDTAEFWATPLGRLMFLGGAYEKDTMTQATAAGVVGVSRQYISALLKRGQLSQEYGSAVRAAEIRDLLKARIDTRVKQA